MAPRTLTEDPRRIRMVSFDIDGTIAVGHGWRTIAEYRGNVREFDRAQVLFTSGRATENQHLETLLNFAQGLELNELEAILARTRHLGHLKDAVTSLRRKGVRVALLTHNPLYVCRWYAKRYGFDLWAGVRQDVRDGKIQAAHDLHVDKRAGLRELLDTAHVDASETAHLGDGRADAEVFPYVATGIALNSRVPKVRRAADLTADVLDARRLLPFLRYGLRLHPRALPSGNPGLEAGSFRCERRKS